MFLLCGQKNGEKIKMFEEKLREEHLEWAKQRALAYIEIGDLTTAFTSLASDLGNHSQTANHLGVQLGFKLMIIGQLSTAAEMKKFIEEIN